MAKIESNLRKLQDTDDLSYAESQNDIEQSSSSTARRLIDQATLAQLLDECKEEQDAISTSGIPR